MPDHAVVGYVHGGLVRAEFCASLLGICLEGKTPVDVVLALESGPNISTARNKLCAEFLVRPGQPPWLFMCDTDMVLEPDTVDRLVAAAQVPGRPVVGGLCWSLDGGVKVTTMYELTDRDGRLAFTRYGTWPADECIQVGATGAACLLIHRSALETVAATSADPAAPWFRETALRDAPLALMGEDLTFCLRLAAAGIPVHVHTGVKAGHMKTQMLI